MLISFGGTHCFIGHQEREELTHLVLNGRAPRDIVGEVVGPGTFWIDAWDPVGREVHRRIGNHLIQQAEMDGGTTIKRLAILDYRGESARRNVLDILHAASLVTRQLRLIPHPRSLAEDVHNRMAIGAPWHSVLGDAATLLFNVMPRSRLAWLLNTRYEAEITFDIREVEAVTGNLAQVSVVFHGVEISFGSRWTIRLRGTAAGVTGGR